MRYARSKNIGYKIPLLELLAAALSIPEKSIFCMTFKSCEDIGLLNVFESRYFESNREILQLQRYVSIYRELLGPQVDMELMT